MKTLLTSQSHQTATNKVRNEKLYVNLLAHIFVGIVGLQKNAT